MAVKIWPTSLFARHTSCLEQSATDAATNVTYWNLQKTTQNISFSPHLPKLLTCTQILWFVFI